MALRIALAVFLFLALFHRHGFAGSDEIGVYEMTRSLAERASLDVREVPHSYPGRDGLRYSWYAVGQAVLALPFHQLGRVAERQLPDEWSRALAGRGSRYGELRYQDPAVFAVLLYPPLATGLLALVFFLFERRLGVSRRHAVACSLLLGVATYAAYMSTLFLRHTTEAVLLLSALYLVSRWRSGGRLSHLALGSGLASLLLLVREPGIYGVGFAAQAALSLRERLARGPVRPLRLALGLLLPPIAAVGAHFAVDYARWGSFLASPRLSHRILFGDSLREGLYGLLLSPGCSVFLYTPLLLLVPLAWPTFQRRHRIEAQAALVGFVIALVFYAGFPYWHGLFSAAGPRYLFPALPPLLLALGPWLDEARGRSRLVAALTLAGLGIVVQLPLMATHWGLLSQAMGYLGSEPEFAFLFVPEQSPILASLRFFARGALNDMWIVSLATGWPGRPPHPGAAALLVALGLLGIAACLRSLWRACRGNDA